VMGNSVLVCIYISLTAFKPEPSYSAKNRSVVRRIFLSVLVLFVASKRRKLYASKKKKEKIL